jgi:hypothetical protein
MKLQLWIRVPAEKVARPQSAVKKYLDWIETPDAVVIVTEIQIAIEWPDMGFDSSGCMTSAVLSQSANRKKIDLKSYSSHVITVTLALIVFGL